MRIIVSDEHIDIKALLIRELIYQQNLDKTIDLRDDSSRFQKVWRENKQYRAGALKSIRWGWKEEDLISDECQVGYIGWFGGVNWLPCWVRFKVAKRFLTGDLGQVTGGELCAMRMAKRLPFAPLLPDLEEFLKKALYKGMVTFYADGDVQLGCEWLLLPVFIEGLRIPFTVFLTWVFTEADVGRTSFQEECALGVHVSFPPYPNEGNFEPVKVGAIHHRHHWFKCYDRGYIIKPYGGWITAKGRTPKECKRRVYRSLALLKAKDKQYRLDGCGIFRQYV